MAVNDGGSAFPLYQDAEYDSGAHALEMIDPGMSLRDWFAGQAINGYLSTSEGVIPPKDAAEQAYRYADAMLLAREAGQ